LLIMNRSYKINVLLIVCIISAATLSCVQYYLVRNTYELSKDKYGGEVKRDMMQIISLPGFIALAETEKIHMKQCIYQYKKNGFPKASFFRRLSHINETDKASVDAYLRNAMNRYAILRGVHLKLQYEEVIVEPDRDADTLLSLRASPILFTGTGFQTINTTLLKREHTINLVSSQGGGIKDYNYSFSQSYYLDISSWTTKVLKRMSGIFLLATGIIVAVIILFYLVFRAFIRQKKIAEMKTDFANNITHELKTPLSSMSLILKSIRRKEIRENSGTLAELLQSLERQQDKIQRIVDSVLESVMTTSFETKKIKLDITAYLHLYARDLVVDHHPMKVEIAPGEQMISTNTASLDKILNSLIENAAKYSPSGTPVVLNAYRENAKYIIEIADSGPGIAPEHHNRIFDKFYRVPEQNKHAVNGIGLGLYLAKQGVEQIGGQINLKSSPGTGAIFAIQLPI